MTHAERQKKIEAYGAADEKLAEALRHFPKEMWTYKPGPERWSIHEIILHLADSEANSYIRCRRFIAEPGATVMAYDENAWATRLNYHGRSAEDALDLFRVLRRMSYHLIKDQPESVWSHTVNHSESGSMRMDDWLDIYTRHVSDHIAQMRATHDAWRAAAAGKSVDPQKTLFPS